MARLNASSVNTLRIYTYRDSQRIVYVLETLVRFGSAGSIKDNASSGGGFFHVNADGFGVGCTHAEGRPESFELIEIFGSREIEIPAYAEAVKMVMSCHDRLPYFDLIGWDVAITEDAEPLLIEYNCNIPGLAMAQMAGGPLFGEGELLEDVMSRVARVRKEKVICNYNIFSNGNRFCERIGEPK